MSTGKNKNAKYFFFTEKPINLVPTITISKQRCFVSKLHEQLIGLMGKMTVFESIIIIVFRTYWVEIFASFYKSKLVQICW